jgi:hypothetical protein
MSHKRLWSVTVAIAAVLSLATPTATSAIRSQVDQSVLDLLWRTNRDAQQFDRAFDLALGRDPNNPVNPTPMENEVDLLANQLMDTTAHLRQHFQRQQVIEADVDEVLSRGARIDEYMRRNQFPIDVDRSWRVVRQDLDELARAFNVNWNWESPQPLHATRPAYYDRLSGTYVLDRSQSDDTRAIAGAAARNLPPGERERVEENLIRRLDPPASIVIDRNGQTVSLASSMAPRSTFDLDGRPRSEPDGYGGVSVVRASLYGDELHVATTGTRGRDFTVTFEPLNAGAMLEVTRTLDADDLSTPVQARSVYRRTSEQADWNVYGPPPPPPSASGWLVPEGTELIGQLSTSLGSRTSRQGDRFSLTVTSPRAFRGAVIDGVVARAGGADRPGRNELFFEFDRIRLRDGRTSEFAGVISQARTPDGRIVMIDTEGVATGSSRSTQAVQGGAIGAAVGAIIGAIAGGGKGAAIGATVGAGAGAGAAYAEGTDLDMPRGTEVHIIAQPVWERR